MASLNSLVEVDRIEFAVIVDNEVDPISPVVHPGVQYKGRLPEVKLSPIPPGQGRGGALAEIPMHAVCCGAHGLSLSITAVKGDVRHTLLFDTGPTEDSFEANAKRLPIDLATVERIHLSHWHRDHSGGMLRAIRMIQDAKAKSAPTANKVVVDLHPDRPDFRGFALAPDKIFSLEADPSFDEMSNAGAEVATNAAAHTVLDDMFLISGSIPRVTEYEGGLRAAMRYESTTGQWRSDELISDERLVMCNLKDKGLVVFTGCSHAGVVNVSKHAVELGGSAPLYAVVGGYHLADATPEKMQSSADDLKKLSPQVMIPGHCTGWRFKQLLEQQMPGSLVPCFVGARFTLNSVIEA